MNKKAFLVIGLLLPYSLYLNGMDINIQLIMAVANNNEKEVQDLINQGADVDVRWHLGRTPLHIAALKGHENIVKILIDNGAKVDAKDNDGSTPLHIAALKGHENIVKILVYNDADVNARDNAGKTPAELATNLSIKNYLRKLALQEKDELLILAAFAGNIELVKKLIIVNHANVNAKDKRGITPLHAAAEGGHESIARFLIQKGAKLNAKDEYGNTPLHVAAGRGHGAVARILIQKGADVNAKDEYGNTPLHCAGRFLEITKLLIYADADVNCRNFYYQTPLDVAISREVKEFLQTIVQKEALPVPLKGVLPVPLIDMKSLDIVLILDNGDEYSSNQEAMRVMLEDAIRQKIFIIASSPLLYALSRKDTIGPLSDSHRWTVYLNKGAKDFVLLIPHPFFLIQLDRLGFNPDQFDRIDSGDIKFIFSSEDYFSKPINIENFKKLFKIPDVKEGASAQEIKQKIKEIEKLFPKRIYLTGHGMEGNTIAKIPIIKYGEFLNILNTINTEFLFVSSCYAGGKNLLEIQSSMEKISRTIPLRYPLVIGATTDEVTVRSKPDFNEFFARLNKWLEGRRFYLGRPISKEKLVLIRDILMSLFKATPALVNLPSIRFPGTRSFFRAVAVDKMLILTYTRLKAFVLEKVYAKQTGIKPPGREPGDITIASDLRIVLLYPSILHSVKFCIRGVGVPLFISKISGKAQHFIERIECKGLNFLEAIIKIFLSPIIAPKGFGATDKAWFIDDVIVKDASYKGVVILKPGGIDLPKAPAKILYNKNGQFFGIKSRLPIRTSLIPVLISEKEYEEQILEIYKKTVPEERALREATGGHESLAMIKKAFQKFMKKVGIIIAESQLSFIYPKIVVNLSHCHKLNVA